MYEKEQEQRFQNYCAPLLGPLNKRRTKLTIALVLSTLTTLGSMYLIWSASSWALSTFGIYCYCAFFISIFSMYDIGRKMIKDNRQKRELREAFRDLKPSTDLHGTIDIV